MWRNDAEFLPELIRVIDDHAAGMDSGTPPDLLASYLLGCLQSYEQFINEWDKSSRVGYYPLYAWFRDAACMLMDEALRRRHEAIRPPTLEEIGQMIESPLQHEERSGP